MTPGLTGFIVGLFCGGMFGFGTAAMLVVCREEEEYAKKREDAEKQVQKAGDSDREEH